MQPPLTTIAQPMPEMGRQAVDMVLALMENGAPRSGRVSNVVVEGRLIVRESSGAMVRLAQSHFHMNSEVHR
jgi:DNA-binding LacI/PurR family transcriptional regulator